MSYVVPGGNMLPLWVTCTLELLWIILTLTLWAPSIDSQKEQMHPNCHWLFLTMGWNSDFFWDDNCYLRWTSSWWCRKQIWEPAAFLYWPRSELREQDRHWALPSLRNKENQGRSPKTMGEWTNSMVQPSYGPNDRVSCNRRNWD